MMDREAWRPFEARRPQHRPLRAFAEPRSFQPSNYAEAPRRDPPVVIGGPLGALGIAAFVCDGKGEVRAMTPPAAAAVAGGRLRLVNHRLAAPIHYDASEMDLAIAAAASSNAPAARGETIVNRNLRDPAAVQVLDVISLPRAEGQVGFEARAIVVLRGGEFGWPGLEQVLIRAFGLTTAEAQVAARMALGASRDQIAIERRASLQTVRSQIKSIFTKLNVTRERELVSLLARIYQR